MGFKASDHALNAVTLMREPLVQIRAADAPLATQLRASAQSVVLNLEEGTWKTGLDRINRYRIAAGSAAETRANLRIAAALGYVTKEAIEPAENELDEVLAILWKLVGPGKIKLNGRN